MNDMLLVGGEVAQAPHPPSLSMVGISKRFAAVQALDKVNFEVQAGEVHALVGENGAGKSTLMKVLFGIEQPDEGQIVLGSRGPVTIASPRHALHYGIGLVSQELSLVPQLDVAQNIFLGSEEAVGTRYITNRSVQRARAKEILRQLDPALATDARVSTLSMAARQIVEIARTLAKGGSIIAFDEPTSSLTPLEKDNLFAIIRQLKAQGKSVIYISHRIPEIQEIADRVTALRDGKVVATRNASELSADQIVRLIVGRDLNREAPTRTARTLAAATAPAQPLLQVKTLSQGTRLCDINLEIGAGEIVGLAGLVGSGRTELARCVFGADKSDHGQVLVDGQVVHLTAPADAIRAGIALLPEDRRGQALVPVMDVAGNFGLPNAKFYTASGFLRLRKRLKDAVGYIRDLAIRPDQPHLQIRWLSGGNQQKVVIARWLKTGARVFIFDEPTRGIDVGAKAEIYRIMRELAHAGCAVLMISSELPELVLVCDRIEVMHAGRIVASVAGADASEELLMHHATGRGLRHEQ